MKRTTAEVGAQPNCNRLSNVSGNEGQPLKTQSKSAKPLPPQRHRGGWMEADQTDVWKNAPMDVNTRT